MDTGGRNLNEIIVIPDANKTLSDILNLTKHQTMGVAIMQKFIIVKEQFVQWTLEIVIKATRWTRTHRLTSDC